MPRYRKRYRKRRGNFLNKTQKVASTAYTALRMAKILKGMVNVEYKFVDNAANSQTATQTPTFILLNGILQGSGSPSSREGINVRLKQLYIRMFIEISGAASQSTIRIMIVRYNSTNGVAPVIGDILDTAGGLSNLVSPINLNNRSKFQVLVDRIVRVSQNGNRNAYFKFFRKLSDKINFSGVTDTVSSISDNTYWLLVWSNQASNFPVYFYHSRVRYIDN